MNKFINDGKVLKLQLALDDAKAETLRAHELGCSDEYICELMDVEDAIIAKLLRMGCHRRDC